MARQPLRVLIVEDSEFDARILVNTLRQGGYEPTWSRVEDATGMSEALAQGGWEIVLADYNLPRFSAPAALELLQQSGQDLPFVIISGGIGEDIAVGAMKAGAHDYLMKGNLARLVPAVERELREAATRRARRAAEEALRESEQRYRLLWENSTDVVIVMGVDSVMQFANPAVKTVFGYEPDRVIGHPFANLLIKERQPAFAQWFASCLEVDDPSRRRVLETVGCHQTEREVFLEIGFSCVEFKTGRFVLAFIRDITERRKAEEESRLLQGISLAVDTARDLDTALSMVLRAVCETTGWAMGQVWLPSHDELSLECAPVWHCAAPGLEPFRRVSEQLHFKPDQGLPGRVWSSKQPLWLPDITSAPNSPRAPVAREVGILAAAGIPVLADDEVVAVIEFFLLERRDEDERMTKLFSAVSAQLGGMVRRKRAEQELRANEEQFRAAREVQDRLFPKIAPALPGFDIAGFSHPASAAGGDYFDYLPMLGDRQGIVIADVTGHGIGPALLMAEARAYLRLLARSHEQVGEILTTANRVLSGDIGAEQFITMLLVGLDPGSRTLSFANAGHPAGYVLGADGRIKLQLKRTGVPLGIQPETQYTVAPPFTLVSGDLVLLLTDGIDEAVAPNDEFFGIDRTLDVVRAHQRLGAAELVQKLYDEVRRFAGNTPQLDDATAVVVKVL
jgi:sigma-B regulation protein RsbU (phosphoserine phosphatase)